MPRPTARLRLLVCCVWLGTACLGLVRGAGAGVFGRFTTGGMLTYREIGDLAARLIRETSGMERRCDASKLTMRTEVTLLLLTACAPMGESASVPLAPTGRVSVHPSPEARPADIPLARDQEPAANGAASSVTLVVPSQDAAPPAYPRVFCAEADPIGDRWMLRIDPTSKADLRRVRRLSEAFPEADGITKALARSNLPPPLRELRELTVISASGSWSTTVRRLGVRPSPSEGMFVFVLQAKANVEAEFGIAVEGTVEVAPTWRSVAKDGHDATLLPEGTVKLQKWMRATLDRNGIEADRSSRFEAVGVVDLDTDGLDEVVVFEHWPEGLFVWLVRYDREREALTGQFICGDAS